MKVSTVESISEYLFDQCLPDKLRCCRKKPKLVALQRARSALESEIDVVKLVRLKRLVFMAFERLLDPPVFEALKAKSRQTSIGWQELDGRQY